MRRHRDHLEEPVETRTGALEGALGEVQRQTEEMLLLSTPILQVRDGVVVAPLIGSLDGERTQRLMEVLLQQIVSSRSTTALIDITGVPEVDSATAQNLIETVTAVRRLDGPALLDVDRAVDDIDADGLDGAPGPGPPAAAYRGPQARLSSQAWTCRRLGEGSSLPHRNICASQIGPTAWPLRPSPSG